MLHMDLLLPTVKGISEQTTMQVRALIWHDP